MLPFSERFKYLYVIYMSDNSQQRVIIMKYPYSVKEAVGYSLILMVSLWWLPVIGPMIIGYVTGRKSGGPVKGIIAMLIPIMLYFFLIYAVGIGWIRVPIIIKNYFTGSVIGIPFVPYLKETIIQGVNIGLNLQNYLYYAPPSFFIMVAFAFIGGAMSRQVVLEKGIYPQRKPLLIRKPKLKNKDIPAISTVATKKKKRKIEDLDREKKFVVHPMDTKKESLTKRKSKKYGIPFL